MTIDESRQSHLTTGCLWILAVVAIIYVSNAARLLIPNAINRSKWERQDITHYEMTVRTIDVVPNEIQFIVQNAKVVGEQSEIAENFTVEKQFKIPADCILLFPIMRCTYSYDPELGYPTETTHFAQQLFCCADGMIGIQTIKFTPLD